MVNIPRGFFVFCFKLNSMIALLSPAKSMDMTRDLIGETTQVRFQDQSEKLVNKLKKQKLNGLKNLFSVSEKIAALNVDRYNHFSEEYNESNSRQAILAFDGDVYKGLNAVDFNKTELKRAQKSIRILSGLYGLIRPLDLIQAYRLEMGTKLKIGRKNNLYEFWDNSITDLLNQDLIDNKSDTIINLASKEYFKAIKTKNLNARVLEVNFKEYKGDQLKFISFNAKKARGLMARYMVKENIKKVEDLKGFNLEQYSFSPEHSSDNQWIFVR